MSEPGVPQSGTVPTGATMQPRYMGRTLNTYPVSEPEMDMISSLSAESTVRFSIASLLFGLAASIWVSALFAGSLKPEGLLACKFVAPVLLLFSLIYTVRGVLAQRKRNSKWEALKKESFLIQAVVPTAGAPT